MNISNTTKFRAATMDANEIKRYIGETQLKTADFVQRVLNDAAGTDENDCQLTYVETAKGKHARYKSIKSPKALVAFWEKHGLLNGALRHHVKAVHNLAEKKLPKVQVVKARKTDKPAKAKTTRTSKKSAPVLRIADYRQGDLNLETIAT